MLLNCLTAFLSLIAPSESAAPAAPRSPATVAPAEARQEPPVTRIFRFHAGARAADLRHHATRGPMDEKRRADLLRRIEGHLRRVEEAVHRDLPAGDASGDAAMARGSALAEEFDAALGRWMEEHPAAAQAVQRQATIAETYAVALTSEPAAITHAARAAGLPPGREADARKVVADRQRRLVLAHEAARKRRARAPPAEDDPAETAAGYDLQLQLVAAAREVRDLVEAMMPAASRPKLDAAMLRWYETYEPG